MTEEVASITEEGTHTSREDPELREKGWEATQGAVDELYTIAERGQ